MIYPSSAAVSGETRFGANGHAIAPTLDEVRDSAARIAPYIRMTPIHQWLSPLIKDVLGPETNVWLKLELLQMTGSFKARGALNTALSTSREQRKLGFTAFSSGNHAAAVAYAAWTVGSSAKVVMLNSANPARVDNCRQFGAEIVFADEGIAALERMRKIEAEEGRFAIHPYEGVLTSAGAGTLALEIHEQIPDLEAIVLAIGGGGLCSGVAATLKQLRPECDVYAVEPAGADTMYRSFRSGKPEQLLRPETIADCLAPPTTLPYSLDLCRENVDELALITDDEIRFAMKHLLSDIKLMVEPGGAAAAAGALGPLRERLRGKRTCILLCGSNIDLPTFLHHIGGNHSHNTDFRPAPSD